MQEQSQFIHELRAHLARTWESLGLSGSPAGLSYRIRQSTRGRILDRGRLVALWFKDNPENPEVVTKWTQTKECLTETIEEYHHVKELYSKDPTLVPKPLGCHEINGIPVLIEEAILGRSFAHQIMSLPFSADRIKAMFAKAGEILKKIEGRPRPASNDECRRELDRHFSQASASLDWDEPKRQKIKRFLETAIPDPVPGSGLAFVVGDFAPHNLLEGPKGVCIIDLEFSRKSPLAFLDALSFVHGMLRFGIRDYVMKEPGDAVSIFQDNLFNEQNFFGGIAREFLRERAISLTHLPWYWTVYFLHEIALQSVSGQPFPPGPKAFFDRHISSMAELVHK